MFHHRGKRHGRWRRCDERRYTVIGIVRVRRHEAKGAAGGLEQQRGLREGTPRGVDEHRAIGGRGACAQHEREAMITPLYILAAEARGFKLTHREATEDMAIGGHKSPEDAWAAMHDAAPGWGPRNE